MAPFTILLKVSTTGTPILMMKMASLSSPLSRVNDGDHQPTSPSSPSTITSFFWKKRRVLFLVMVLVQTITKLSSLAGPLKQTLQSATFQRVTTVVASLKKNNRVFYSCTLPVNAIIGNETLQEERTITLPQVPDFIIIGAQKAGTTAIRKLLSLHPSFRNSTLIEPHFFDMHDSSLKLDNHSIIRQNSGAAKTATRRGQVRKTRGRRGRRRKTVDKRVGRRLLTVEENGDEQEATTAMEKLNIDPLLLCETRHAYAKSFDLDSIYAEQRRLIYYEKTPSYIITDGAAAKIRAVTPWAKIVVSLRNPIDRCFSQYKMEVERSGDQYSFEHWIARDLAVLRSTKIRSIVSLLPKSNEHLPRMRRVTTDYGYFRPPSRVLDTGEWKSANCIYRGMYAHQLQEQWLDHYTLNKDLLVVEFGRLQRTPREVLKQILDFVDTSSSSDGNDSNDDNDSSSNGQNRSLLQQNNIYQEEHFNTSYSPNPGEIRLVMSNTTRNYLQRLYKPFNDQLADILGDEWRGIWD